MSAFLGLRDVVLTRLVDPALYDVSVRSKRSFDENATGGEDRPALMHAFAGFLPTVGHPSAVAFGYLIGSVFELPVDGTPVLRPVFGKRFDAWARLPDERICDVFVRREPRTMRVSVAPSWHHGDLRIPIRYDDRKNRYASVCWNVAFDMKGKEITNTGMKPIGFDLGMLPVQVDRNEIWVCLDSTPR